MNYFKTHPAVCGSSFDSYNSFGLNPLGYNSQASFNASNTSFNTNTNTASSLLLDQTYGNVGSVGSSNGLSAVVASQNQATAPPGTSYHHQTPNTLNLPNNSPHLPSFSTNSGGSPAYANTPSPYDPSSIISTPTEESYENLVGQQPNSSSTDHHLHHMHHQHLHQHSTSSGTGTAGTGTTGIGSSKQQLDDQLMSKVSQMSLEQVTKLLAQKQRELHTRSRIIRNQIASSTEIVTASGRDLRQDKEEFC